jgi:hypothetical protein
MLLITSESSQQARTLNDVTRELSLTPACFASARTLTELMGGHARRIILLRETDVVEDVVTAIETTAGPAEFGVIVAADREALRLSSKAELLTRLADINNVWWIGVEFDFDQLSEAARNCRRRMLRLSPKELEDAIVKDEFVVQYQPKVERSSGTEWLTHEAEALVRWRHPQHGLVGPLEFLPEVEAFGLMGSISEFVLREAASQLQRWEQQGLILNSCINLASSLLSEPSLADQYEEIVTSVGLECSRFTFEIAEQELADSEAPHLKALAALSCGSRVSRHFRAAAVRRNQDSCVRPEACATRPCENDDSRRRYRSGP